MKAIIFFLAFLFKLKINCFDIYDYLTFKNNICNQQKIKYLIPNGYSTVSSYINKINHNEKIQHFISEAFFERNIEGKDEIIKLFDIYYILIGLSGLILTSIIYFNYSMDYYFNMLV